MEAHQVEKVGAVLLGVLASVISEEKRHFLKLDSPLPEGQLQTGLNKNY